MCRLAACLIGLALSLSPFALAQSPDTNAQNPEDAFSTRELIAWSSVQKPQPAPQPLPPPDKAVPEPGQQSAQADHHSQTAASESPANSFVGTIVRDKTKYLLRVSEDSEYQLSGSGDIGQFVDKNVKVTGDLAQPSHTIQVARIEPLS
jgi:hypothetical protein